MLGEIWSFVEKKRKALRASWALILIGMIVIYAIYMIITKGISWYTIKEEHDAVTRKIEEETILQQQLKAECTNLDDLNYIEQVARDEFGMVKEGEVPFISREKKTN